MQFFAMTIYICVADTTLFTFQFSLFSLYAKRTTLFSFHLMAVPWDSHYCYAIRSILLLA